MKKFILCFVSLLVSLSLAQNWTWIAGTNSGNGAQVSGSVGVAASNYIPAARQFANVIFEESSKYWYLLGGLANSNGHRNDLWRYNVATSQWALLMANLAVNCSVVNVPSTSYQPTQRFSATTMINKSDRILYYFGGKSIACGTVSNQGNNKKEIIVLFIKNIL
jgi:hypothetical protein